MASKQYLTLNISTSNSTYSTLFLLSVSKFGKPIWQNTLHWIHAEFKILIMVFKDFWTCYFEGIKGTVWPCCKNGFHISVVLHRGSFPRNSKRFITIVKQLWLEDTEEKCRAYIISRITTLIRISKHTMTFTMHFPCSSTCLNRREGENQRVKTLVKIYGRDDFFLGSSNSL